MSVRRPGRGAGSLLATLLRLLSDLTPRRQRDRGALPGTDVNVKIAQSTKEYSFSFSFKRIQFQSILSLTDYINKKYQYL